MKIVDVKVTTLEKMLGLSPSDKDLYSNYIGKGEEVPQEKLVEEIESIPASDELDLKSTVFLRDDDGDPCFFDYQIKGYFKDSCAALSRLCEKDPSTGKKKLVTKSGRLTAYKKVIDGSVFVAPRKIKIHFDGDIGWCERPLRAQTLQGERIALARSEEIPAGAILFFKVLLLNDDHLDILQEWLNYGHLRGLGQWRNSGKGRFKNDILNVKERPFDLDIISEFQS